MAHKSDIFAFDDVLTYEYVDSLREANKKKRNDLQIIAQRGAQERMLSQDVDIWIGGGSRGGSKSFSLLLEGLKDCQNQFFQGIIFRAEKPDLATIENTSEQVYQQYGVHNISESKKYWDFNNGGRLKFSYYLGDSYEEFKRRFQGHEYCYIGIDEITQMPYERFKYIWTCNRNSHGLKNRLFGTCNPDEESWVFQFLQWYLDEDGYPIPDRDGVVRYCFMKGNSVADIVWGDSREEVYEQCKEDIDRQWERGKETYERDGYDKLRIFIPSVCFVRADITDNQILLSSDPGYIARLANQDEAQVMRDLEACWRPHKTSDDMIKYEDMEAIFSNSYQYEEDDAEYASGDVAFTGGDNFVMWRWKGMHIKDIVVLNVDAKVLVSVIKQQLRTWGIPEDHFTYDVNGIGQALKGHFPDAVPFNNMAAPMATTRDEESGIKALYKDLKSQCAYLFYQLTKETKWSIEADLLDRRFSGNGFSKLTLRQILQRERKCIKRDEQSADRAFKLIKKDVMKKYVGHSPDFFEALIYRMIFTIKRQHKKPKGLWRI